MASWSCLRENLRGAFQRWLRLVTRGLTKFFGRPKHDRTDPSDHPYPFGGDPFVSLANTPSGTASCAPTSLCQELVPFRANEWLSSRAHLQVYFVGPFERTVCPIKWMARIPESCCSNTKNTQVARRCGTSLYPCRDTRPAPLPSIVVPLLPFKGVGPTMAFHCSLATLSTTLCRVLSTSTNHPTAQLAICGPPSFQTRVIEDSGMQQILASEHNAPVWTGHWNTATKRLLGIVFLYFRANCVWFGTHSSLIAHPPARDAACKISRYRTQNLPTESKIVPEYAVIRHSSTRQAPANNISNLSNPFLAPVTRKIYQFSQAYSSLPIKENRVGIPL